MAGQTLVVLAAPCHRRSDLGRAHLSRHLGARLRESQTLGDPRLSRTGASRDAASLRDFGRNQPKVAYLPNLQRIMAL